MSWFNPQNPIRFFVTGLQWPTVITACLFVAACGFQPLYGERQNAANNALLAAIQIDPIKEREGQLLYQYLTKKMHMRGKSANPRWRLKINLTKSIQGLGIRKDETTTRNNLILNAQFELYDKKSGKVIHSGQAVSTNSYNVLESRFASIVSEQNAVQRGTKDLSNNIKNRTAVFLVHLNKANAARAKPAPAGPSNNPALDSYGNLNFPAQPGYGTPQNP